MTAFATSCSFSPLFTFGVTQQRPDTVDWEKLGALVAETLEHVAWLALLGHDAGVLDEDGRNVARRGGFTFHGRILSASPSRR